MSTTPDPMTVLYWFSGTGNSLAAARALAAALGQVPLIAVSQALHAPPAGAAARTVGIVFPVYAFGLPNLIARFLEVVPLGPDPYVFTVATAAGMPGATHRQAADILNRRGVALAAGWTLRMPENFSLLNCHLGLRSVPTLLQRATERTAVIARSVQAGTRGVQEDSLLPLAWAGGQVHHGASRFLPAADRRFEVGAHCSACGLCAAVCPVGNIRIDNGRPAWSGHCEGCGACMQWCPVRAIRMKGFVANRRRYHHPEVRAHDIALQGVGDD